MAQFTQTTPYGWSSGTDPWNWNNSGWLIGKTGSNVWNSAYWFSSVSIPKGATITSAKLNLKATAKDGGTVKAIIYCNDVDNCAGFNTTASITGATVTTANTTWDISTWSTGSYYDTPDLTSAVQEVINRTGWASGNVLGFVFWDNGTDTGNNVNTDSGHTTVTIDYLAPSIVAPSVTTQAASILSLNSCTANGTITDTGGENATIRGFAYKAGTTGNPTTADNFVHEDGSFGAEAYDLPITGLNSEKSWRIAAYATNSIGTTYGSTVQLTLPVIKKIGGVAKADIKKIAGVSIPLIKKIAGVSIP